ncbi:MAG TPA: carbohydrate kinase family protein [Roseiarcus sp.]|nr:carbohydrate kinase family protein [Roseiarcus sp.]
MSAALQSTEGLPLFLCIGDLDVDVLIEVDRLPTRDGKVNGVVKQKAPGGMAGNVAAALARLGSRVRVLSRVGGDADGAFAVKSLEQAGVDTSFVSRLDGIATFSCISLLTPDGEKSLVKLMTSAYRPDASDVTEAALNGVRHLHLTSIGDPALCRRVVGAARSSGATASLDIERADCPEDAAALLDAIKGFDLIFCNAESRAFVDAALERPLAGLVAAVVTTLGADGAQVETAEGRISSPGFTPKIVDTTGAGDCFAAACLHARLAARLDWRDAIRFANCAAAISTTGLGAQSALPTADQVAAHLSATPART